MHKLTQIGTLSRKQTQLVQGLVLGQTVEAAASAAGIARRTAHSWLKLPVVIAERERLETELRKAEEAEITRIMTTGYAAIHERVKALDHMARELQKPYVSPDTGKVYELRNSPEHVREWRGVLDDIAKETGGRIKRAELTGKDGGAIQMEGLLIDTRNLSKEQLDLLKSMAQTMKDKEQ